MINIQGAPAPGGIHSMALTIVPSPIGMSYRIKVVLP